MKKVLAIVLALVMVTSLSITTFAKGGFIVSPSNNDGPTLEDFKNESEDCTGVIVVTPYHDRDNLDPTAKDLIEDAYDRIKGTDDLTNLTDELEDVAKKNNVDPDNLGVSNLFDVSYEGCTDHNSHGPFTITISDDTAENFIALMQWNGTSWTIIKNVVITGNKLTFTSDQFGPYAIVTATGSPSTGDNVDLVLYITLMVVSAAALVTVLVIYKKKNKKAE